MTSAALVCPLLSLGNKMDMICLKDRCAWYLPACGTCSMYIMAHDAAMNVRAKQNAAKRTP